MFQANYFKYPDMPIIPLFPKRKNPIIEKWSIYCEEVPPEDLIDSWIKKYPNANIGLCLGKSSKLIAIDIDKEEAKKLVPLSPIVKTGAKGETRFFKYNGEVPFKRLDLGIELLSTGNQTVMPPSIHPDTNKEYRWVKFECDWDDLPDLDPEFIKKINNTNKSSSSIIPSDGSRCEHGSHNKLSEMLVAALNKNDPPETIVDNLIKYDEKINPTISYFLCPSRKEWKTNNKLVNAYQFVTEGMRRHAELVKPQVQFSVVDSKEKSSSPSTEVIDYKKEKLPKFRGVAQEMFEYIYKTSPIPRSRFAVASTIATMGTILSNRVKCIDIHPNFYVLITAISAGGKDAALRFPYNLFNKAKCKDLVGGSPESDSGVLVGLDKQTTRLDVFDEASRLFYMMGDTKNLYAGKIADQYASLYTSAGKFFPGKTLKKEKLGECFSPCVSLLCALTVSDFQKSFTTELLSKGIGGRFLFFPDTEYKDIQDRNMSEIPESIVNFCHRVRNNIDRRKVVFEESNKSIDLKISDDTKKRHLKIGNDYRRAGNKDHQNLEPIYNRAIEVIMKLAILDSVSIGNSFEVSNDNLDWAVHWFDSYMASLSLFLGKNLFSSKQQLIEQEIVDIIRQSNTNGTTKSDLLRSSVSQRNYLRSKELDLYLDTIVEKEYAFCKKIKGNGSKPSFIFYHSDFVDKIADA